MTRIKRGKTSRANPKKSKRQRLDDGGDDDATTAGAGANQSNRASRIITKKFDIFVTDFLADPCALPEELRDCVLVDGAVALNEGSDSCPANNSHVLKKIFGNNEANDRMGKTSSALAGEGELIAAPAFATGCLPCAFEKSSKKALEAERVLHVQ